MAEINYLNRQDFKEYAKKTPFKTPIVHGFLAGSVFSKVFGTIYPGEGTIYLKQEMFFLKPMFTDQPYKAVFEIINTDFENDLLKYGIKSYMADYSVNLKKIKDLNFYKAF